MRCNTTLYISSKIAILFAQLQYLLDTSLIDKSRMTTWSFLSRASVLGGLFLTVSISVLAQPESCPGGVHPNPSSTTSTINGCYYGGCMKSDGTTTRRCVHDSTFCTVGETFVTAEDLIVQGKQCTCEDILNYPQTIGICQHADGVYTPMVNLTPEEGSAPLCAPDAGGLYTVGDPVVSPFTACDLPCNKIHDHIRPTKAGEYEGCLFPPIEWAVANTAKPGYYWVRDAHVLGDQLIIVGDVRNIDAETEENNFAITGPFTAQDPTGENGVTLTRSIPYPEDSSGTAFAFEREYDFDTGITVRRHSHGRTLGLSHLWSKLP